MNATSRKAPSGDRTQRRAMRTRKRLLEAALAMFTDRGVDAATIEDITERADVGKGTFYRHFASKEDVMLALIEDAVDQLIGRLVPAGQADSIEASLDQLIQGHADFFSEQPDAFVLLFQGRVLLKLQREIGEELEAPYVRYLEEIEARIRPYAARPVDAQRVRRLSCALAGFVSGFFSFAMIGMDDAEIERSVAPLRRAFVAASSTFLGKDNGRSV